jgi:hypothetical protein
VTQEELQKKIDQYLATLPVDKDHEWYTTHRSVGLTVLRAFLWWLYPELKPKDLSSWDEWPGDSEEV